MCVQWKCNIIFNFKNLIVLPVVTRMCYIAFTFTLLSLECFYVKYVCPEM
jgi:hypothetical protein